MTEYNWYWNKGLFDAEIIKITQDYFQYDYTEKNPVRSCLTIELDAKAALYDTSVKQIKLYNSKVVSGNISVSGWWKEDAIETANGKHTLTLVIATKGEDETLKISFEKCLIVR